MNIRQMSWENRIRLICTLLMLGWAAYIFYSMYKSYYVLYPYSPESLHNYAYNVESSFRVYGVMFLVETIVLAAIWRPWSFRLNNWVRFLIALPLFGIWSCLVIIFTFCEWCGNEDVAIIHFMGLVGCDVLILAFLAISIVASLIIYYRRKKNLS